VERSWIAGVVIAVCALVGAVVLWPSPAPAPVVEHIVSRPVPQADAPLVVHVSGAVAEPGLVSLPFGSRVADAILAAGGASSEAVLSGINLAAPITNGQRVVIPTLADASVRTGGIGGGPVALNHASVSELEELPGVGPVLAQRIIDHRDRHGPFTTVEDLLDVAGIGEAKLAALRDYVVAP
jgi:competence protein ComEA